MKTPEPAVPGVRDLIIAFGGRALDAEEVAKLFNTSAPLIYKQAREGLMPSFRVGTAVRFDPKKLADWYERQ